MDELNKIPYQLRFHLTIKGVLLIFYITELLSICFCFYINALTAGDVGIRFCIFSTILQAMLLLSHTNFTHLFIVLSTY